MAWWVLALKPKGGIRPYGPFSSWELAKAFGSRLEDIALVGELPTSKQEEVLPLLNEHPELREGFEDAG